MNYSSARAAQENLRASGARELGSLLWWALGSNQISSKALAKAAADHGLKESYLPSAVKPFGAFRRAIRHASTMLPAGQMLRLILETPEELVFGLVEERADPGERDLQYDVLVRISFDRARERIVGDADHRVVEDIQRLYRRHLDHTTEDVRSMMTNFLTEAGVSLRDSGGVYFVPSTHRAQFEALCKVVEAVGPNRTFTLPVFDTKAAKATLREVAEKTLDDEVRQLETELASFNFEKARDSTLERRIEMFDQLRNRAGLFADVLSFKADTLNQRIATMRDELRRRLAIDFVPADAPSPEPIPPTNTTSSAFATDVGF